MPTVSIVEAKSHFSEIVAQSVYNKERYIITKRNKPVAALVSIEDLTIIEQHQEKAGLSEIAGKWKNFNEVAKALTDLDGLRTMGGNGRDVSL